jgi:ABC-type lipoprotein release transport system permease subunit
MLGIKKYLFIIKYAINNIIKRKQKSVFVIIICASGIMAIILAGSFISTLSENWRQSFSDEFTGDIIVTCVKGEKAAMDYAKPFSLPVMPENERNKIEKWLGDNPQVLAYSSRLRSSGLLFDDKTGRYLPIMLMGINPLHEPSITKAIRMIKGKYIDENKRSIIVPANMVKSLNVKINDKLIIFCKNRDEILIPQILITTGFYSAPVQNYLGVNGYLIVNLSGARMLLGEKDDSINEIVIKLKNRRFIESFKNDLLKITRLNIIDSKQAFIFYNGLMQFYGFISIVFNILIFLVAGIGIYSSQYNKVLFRKKEIGTMLAIGAENRQILMLFMIESLFEGILAFFSGTFLSYLLTPVINKLIVGSPFFKIIFLSGINIKILPISIFYAFMTIIIVSLLSAWIPSERATHLQPIEVLREQ